MFASQNYWIYTIRLCCGLARALRRQPDANDSSPGIFADEIRDFENSPEFEELTHFLYRNRSLCVARSIVYFL